MSVAETRSTRPGSRLSRTRFSASTASGAKSASASSRITTPETGRPHAPTARIYTLLLGVATFVIAIDQATKQLALDRLSGRPPYDLLGDIVSLRLTFNPGGAFGLFQGYPWFFLVATVAIVVGILIGARRIDDARWAVPLGAVLGGGLGNAIDRVFRDTGGGVVDFIDFHFWPVFNVADMAIVCGALAILFIGWRSEDRSTPGDEQVEP